MHDLDDQFAALGVHGVGHFAPAFDLCVAVNAGCAPIALAGGTGLRSFGHDEPRRGALPVVLHHEVIGDIVRAGTVARHRSHDDTVCKIQIAKPNRRK